jgi:hypothetical protein
MNLAVFRDPRLRELLLWCAPALLVGTILRIFMEMRMPYGYIQFDSADFLLTPYRLLADHHYVIDSKKAFLTPTFYTIPFLLHIPALLFIPIVQHLMGLLEVVIAGALIRLWLPLWRWIIIPATLLIAASPWQLWYEQTLMGEANYVFFLFLIAWLGTHWALKPAWGNFTAFALALFCTCGTRAEGKIMILFGFALVAIVLRGQWKPMLIAAICLAGLYEIAGLGGGGSHAFSLLYATLFELTPDDIHSAPDIAPYLLPLRDQTIQAGADSQTDLVELAKQINVQVLKYVEEKRGANEKKTKALIASVEKDLCVEILRRRPMDVVMMPFVKFQLASDGWASGADFGRHALLEKQPSALLRLGGEMPVMGPGLTGQPQDPLSMQRFITLHYHPKGMAWFGNYEQWWNGASIALRLPDRPATHPRWAHDFISDIPDAENVIPGVPFYFLAAFAGMLAAMFIPDRLRLVQAAWLLAMLLTWYAATMVGVTNARFRFAYEPVCYVYGVAAIVWTIGGVIMLARRGRKPEVPCIAS